MKFSQSLAALACAIVLPLSAFAQTKQVSGGEATQTAPVKQTTSAPIVRTKTSKPTKGVVVSLLTFKRVNGQEAGAMANKNALGLMVGSRIIYVVKADGSSAGDDLARLADAPVGVVGKMMSRGGMTVMLADMIETMK